MRCITQQPWSMLGGFPTQAPPRTLQNKVLLWRKQTAGAYLQRCRCSESPVRKLNTPLCISLQLHYSECNLQKYFFFYHKASLWVQLYRQSWMCTAVRPPRSEHHKPNVIPEHRHKDAFISVELVDSPSSARENLSDLPALLITPA